MTIPPPVVGLFFPEPLPPEDAGSQYRAFRAVLPFVTITGKVRSITLTEEGKLAITSDEHVEFVPKSDVRDRSESHILLPPGGVISPELIAKP
jgi:hypothetical protein